MPISVISPAGYFFQSQGNVREFDNLSEKIDIFKWDFSGKTNYDHLTLDKERCSVNNKVEYELLREAAIPIAKPLCHLLNYSLSTWYFPEVWKTAHVIPIHKKTTICFAIIIGQFPYYATYQRFLKIYCSNTYIISERQMVCLKQTSLDLPLVTSLLIS